MSNYILEASIKNKETDEKDAHSALMRKRAQDIYNYLDIEDDF